MTDNHGLPRKGCALLVSPADQHEQELSSDSLFDVIKQVLVSLSYIEVGWYIRACVAKRCSLGFLAASVELGSGLLHLLI